MKKMDLAREARKSIEAKHYRNAEGVFIGYKVEKGKRTKTLAVLVCVSRKLSESQLRPQDIVPKVVNVSGRTIKTDVIQTGKFKALTLIDDGRPVKPGYSVGHPDMTAGTLGFFAKRNGKTCLISNAHVLANVNKGKIGDPSYYPGPYDGGTKENTIAHLVATIPIEMLASDCFFANAYVNIFNSLAKFFKRKSRIPPPVREVTNQVDCAASEMIDGIEIDQNIPYIGKPIGIVEAELGMEVQKTGRTTEYTKGEVIGIEGAAQVSYGEHGVAVFEDQIMSDIPSAGGDSGSAVLHENKLVGLLFAGGAGTTIMNRMQTVFDELGLEEIGVIK